MRLEYVLNWRMRGSQRGLIWDYARYTSLKMIKTDYSFIKLLSLFKYFSFASNTIFFLFEI